MAEVRGVLVNAMKAFLNQTYGAAAVENAVATLPAEEVALVQKKCLDASFYPYETMVALRHQLRALAAENPRGVATLADDTCSFLADYVFKGVYKAFVAKDAPAMVGKIPWLKDFFYRDFEKVTAAMTGPASCKLIYEYEPGVRQARAVCRSLASFWARGLELAGAKKVVWTHGVCVCDGAPSCEFVLSW